MIKIPLKQTDAIPENLLSATHRTLHSILPEPTLFHLPGAKGKTLFISALQHGNEPTGFIAVQTLLKKYRGRKLPRPVSIFFGNTKAAEQNLRRLDEQPDFNRIWPGTDHPESEETRLTREIVAIMQARGVFASIDIHNNTGLNPHYACINKIDNRFFQLASLFGRLIVYFIRPTGVQSAAFAKLCPAVTLECGRPGQQYGVEHALDFLETCLHLKEIPNHPVSHHDVDIFHTVAQVKIRDNITFSFNKPDVDLQLNEDLEKMNFTEIPAGTVFGKVYNTAMPVVAKNEHGAIITERFFNIIANELQLKRATMPSMLTLDKRVIEQDCFCYLMERMQA